MQDYHTETRTKALTILARILAVSLQRKHSAYGESVNPGYIPLDRQAQTHTDSTTPDQDLDP